MNDQNYGGVERMNVSLYPEQAEVVRKLAKQTGIENFSGALRFLITDWANSQRANLGKRSLEFEGESHASTNIKAASHGPD